MDSSSNSRLLISIVINNYNYEKYVGRAIDSALAQTWPHVEVIVVDDGSTDRSREVIAAYGNKITAVFKPNGGQGSCYNAGLAESKGRVICFLDSDDILDSDACSLAAKIDWDEVSKAQGRLQMIDQNGVPFGALIPFNKFEELNVYSVALRFYAYSSPPGSGNFYNRHFLDLVMPMDAHRWKISADAYLIFRAPFHGRVANIDEKPIGQYRVHSSSASGAGLHKLGSDEIMQYARKEYLKELKRKSVVRDYYTYIFGHHTSLHDTPSLIKLRVLIRIAGRQRRSNLKFWLSIFYRTFYATVYWNYYSYWKRILFFGWILFCAIAPRFLVMKLAARTIYAYQRGF